MSGETVSRIEFATLQNDMSDIKSLLGQMVAAMGKLAVIDERQVSFNEMHREILKRLGSIESRQHKADVEAARTGDTGSRLGSLEKSVREMHIEREKDKASQAGMKKMVGWMWAGVPAFTAVFVWLAQRGVFN